MAARRPPKCVTIRLLLASRSLTFTGTISIVASKIREKMMKYDAMALALSVSAALAVGPGSAAAAADEEVVRGQ